MEEHWRRIVGFEELYAVSTFGRVISLAKGIILKPRMRGKGRRARRSDHYPFVELSKNNQQTRVNIHKLVLTTWVRPRREGEECRHLDGEPTNNHLTNLKWGSFHENRMDWHKHKKRIKLTPEMVLYIRDSPKSHRQLAKELGVAKSTIQYAKGYWNSVARV